MKDRFLVPRIVVVKAEPARGEAPAGVEVGVMRWADHEPRLSVIVKATLTFAAEKGAKDAGRTVARFADEGEAFTLDQPSANPAAKAEELHYASDFVPRKGPMDILVVGHAHGATPSPKVEGSVSVAGFRRSFVAKSKTAARAIALTAKSLRDSVDTSGAFRLGPLALPEELPDGHENFDFSFYNAAHPSLRQSAPSPDATIELEGLSRGGGRRTFELPGLFPVVTVDLATGPEIDLRVACDTLWIDVDREVLVLVYRGDFEVYRMDREIKRIVVSVERLGGERSPEARLSALQRGTFGFAVREQDVVEGEDALTEDDEERLQMARYETWESAAPDPRVSLEEYATLSAKLAEWPDRRRDLLEEHGFDEDSYTIEERSWLERMGTLALDGDATVANEYGELFVVAQDALGTEDEEDQSIEEFAELKAEMDEAVDPNEVLGARKLTLAAWMRMDRRWTRRATIDPQIEVELEFAVERHRGKVEE